jgi:hypothetical protein
VRTYPYYTYEEREKGKEFKLLTLYWMGKIMDALLRLLCWHLSTIWLRARNLFSSIRFHVPRNGISTSSETRITHRDRPLKASTLILASSSALTSRLLTIMTKMGGVSCGEEE